MCIADLPIAGGSVFFLLATSQRPQAAGANTASMTAVLPAFGVFSRVVALGLRLLAFSSQKPLAEYCRLARILGSKVIEE
jgi:hypothetical protein